MDTPPPTTNGPNLADSNDPATGMDTQRLVSALLEVEQHVHQEGWDGPPRLFALGRLGHLVQTEPELAQALGLEVDAQDSDDFALIPIEQEWGSLTGPLDESLAQIMWPPQVAGAAITMERVVLPPAAEEEVAAESDPQAQLELAMNHPERQDMRVAVAVLRDGPHMCAVRVRGETDQAESDPAQAEPESVSTPSPEPLASAAANAVGDPEVLTGPDLVPGLVDALRATFQDEPE